MGLRGVGVLKLYNMAGGRVWVVFNHPRVLLNGFLTISGGVRAGLFSNGISRLANPYGK